MRVFIILLAASAIISLASEVSVIPAASAGAPDKEQQQAIDDLKGKIFNAHNAQKTFAEGLNYCKELDGNHFYFPPRKRVITLDEEYHRALESLAKQQAFDPDKGRPWTEQDAAERWEQAHERAVTDKAICALVESLPDLEKQLEKLEQQQMATERP